MAVYMREAHASDGWSLPGNDRLGISITQHKDYGERCQAAKALNIQVNPQFGQLNYDQLSVVAAPGSVFRTAGPAPTASASGLTPAC